LLPRLDGVPATISRVVLTGLLRNELGFEGVCISDALDMGAIAGGVGVGEGAVRSLAAGADLLCLGPAIGAEGTLAVRSAIVAAVESGRLPEKRVHEAAARVEGLGAWTRARRAPALAAGVGASAAQAALRAVGGPRAGARSLVVELWPEPNIAAGVLPV